MDPKVAEKFAQALADCAVRQDTSALQKQATEHGLVKTALDDFRASPYVYGPAIGALLGGASGYFSDDDEKKKLRNMLYGAGFGGLAGLSLPAIINALRSVPSSPTSVSLPGSQPAAAQAGGAAAADKPGIVARTTTGAKQVLENALQNSDATGNYITTGGGAGVGLGVGGRYAARRVPQYSLSRAAAEINKPVGLLARVAGRQGPTSVQKALAQRLTQLDNVIQQGGGNVAKVTDNDLIGVTGRLTPNQRHAAGRLREVASGKSDFPTFARVVARLERQGGKPRFTSRDVPESAFRAGRRSAVSRGGVGGAIGAAIGGYGAHEAGQMLNPHLKALGDMVGEQFGTTQPSK
jgi:hypothetical protein